MEAFCDGSIGQLVVASKTEMHKWERCIHVVFVGMNPAKNKSLNKFQIIPSPPSTLLRQQCRPWHLLSPFQLIIKQKSKLK